MTGGADDLERTHTLIRISELYIQIEKYLTPRRIVDMHCDHLYFGALMRDGEAFKHIFTYID
jgi:hypothetical protein